MVGVVLDAKVHVDYFSRSDNHSSHYTVWKKCFESKEGILSFGWSKFHLSSDPVENGSLDLQISSAAADPAIIDPNGK